MEDTIERRPRGRPPMTGHSSLRIYIPANQANDLRQMAEALDKTQASLIREGVRLLLEKWSEKDV
jgi:hypothetical protein